MDYSTINGVKVEHGDVIIHTTTTQFGFIDRVRILFGRKLTVSSYIYCHQERVDVVASVASTIVHPSLNVRAKAGTYTQGFEQCIMTK